MGCVLAEHQDMLAIMLTSLAALEGEKLVSTY